MQNSHRLRPRKPQTRTRPSPPVPPNRCHPHAPGVLGDLPTRSQGLRIVGQLSLPALHRPKRARQARVHDDTHSEVGAFGRVLACGAGRGARETRGRRAGGARGHPVGPAVRPPHVSRREREGPSGPELCPGSQAAPRSRLPSARPGPPRTSR